MRVSAIIEATRVGGSFQAQPYCQFQQRDQQSYDEDDNHEVGHQCRAVCPLFISINARAIAIEQRAHLC